MVCVLYAVLALAQNLTPYLAERPDPVGREPVGVEAAKLILLLDEAFQRAGFPTSGMFGPMAASQFANDRLLPASRLQTVLVLGETDSPEAALDWLAAVRSGQKLAPLADQLTKGGNWRGLVDHAPGNGGWTRVEIKGGEQDDPEALADAETMHALYTVGPESLTPEQQTRLRDRYTWLGELALAPKDSPERAALFGDIPWAVALVVIVLALLVAAGIGGLTMFCLAAFYFFSGRLKRRFVPPPRGGSVFLETFAVFLAGFGLVHFGAGLIEPSVSNPRWLLIGTLLAQWLLLLTIFWPRLRGVSRAGWRDAVGWRTPRGVWREILAGAGGYFACLPVYLVAMLLTVLLNLLTQWLSKGPIEPPQNPMIDLVANGDALVIVLFLALATVWAPVVEETLFRGSLYRHMRARHGAFVCAAATALLFAFMHSYGPLMVAPLITLGFTFAMIREWRGSLIGAVTAHCLHNSTLMVLTLVGLQAMT